MHRRAYNDRRGVWIPDRRSPCSLVRDDEDYFRFHFQTANTRPPSRGMVCPSFAGTVCPLDHRGSRECRMRAAPAVSCASCTKKCAHEHTGSAEAIRHSLRNGLTAYAVLSPATNSSCHRRCRLDGTSDPVGSYQPPTAWHQQRVSGPHGFAVRVCAVRPARRLIAHERLALRHLRADAAASTASPPAFVTIAIRPSCRERTGRAGSADLPDGTSGIFFEAG